MKIHGENISTEDIRNVVLSTVAVAGILAVGIMAPNVLQALASFSGKKKSHWSPYYAKKLTQRLERQGFIVFKKHNGMTVARLTPKGEHELLRYKIKEKTFKKKRWDGLWRLVAFDIKEYRKGTRDHIRRELQNFGFVKLQNSMWVFPYDCEEIISLLKTEYKIGKDVLYIVANHIENDRLLKEHFELT